MEVGVEGGIMEDMSFCVDEKLDKIWRGLAEKHGLKVLFIEPLADYMTYYASLSYKKYTGNLP
ncbi:unnamed protein product, partial [marine sediment metagenome]